MDKLVTRGWTVRDNTENKSYDFPTFSKMILWFFELYAKIRRDKEFHEAWNGLEKHLKENNLLQGDN